MHNKQRNTNRTFIAGLDIKLADFDSVNVLHKDTHSLLIDAQNVLKTGDVIVGPTTPIVLVVNKLLFVKAWDAFVVTITNNTSVSINCQGLFLSYITAQSVTISSATELRVSYSYA